MGKQEFATPVRGSGAEPIQTNAKGSIETNNYTDGAVASGSTYPLSKNPGFIVQHMVVTENPGGKTLDLTLSDGSTITGIPLGKGNLVVTALEVDSLTVNDANASGGTTSILLMGD